MLGRFKHGFRLKNRSKHGSDGISINVTPMIDMFSVLNSFLLMTAVFSSTGLIKVEVPFISSKAPPTQEEIDKNPQKVVTAVLRKTEIELQIGSTDPLVNPKKETFNLDTQGLDVLQGKLYNLRLEDRKFDRVTLMTDPEVEYEILVLVIDAMRELKPGRQPIPFPADYLFPSGVDPSALIPKIVLGNVIL